MAKTDDWMPLIIARWRRGTAFMTPAARGVYLDLLLVCWEQGRLPTSDEVLQPLARCTEKVWRQVRDAVVDKFQERDGFLYHDVVDAEKQKANEIYERKSAAGKAGGQASGKQRAKQKRRRNEADVQAEPEAEAQAQTNTTYLEHSPVGEKAPNGALRRATKSPKGTRLENDWKPDAKTLAVGRGLGLTDAEIAAELEPGGPFFDHFQSAECSDPVRPGWDLSARKWLRRGAGEILKRRTRGGSAIGNQRGGNGIAAYLRKNLASQPLPDGPGVQGFGGDVSDQGPAESGPGEGDSVGSIVIDADYVERVPDAAGEASDPDPSEERDGGGSRALDGDLPRAAREVPSGCGPVCGDEPDGIRPMVAGMGDPEGEARAPHWQAAPAADSADELELPAFLDVRWKRQG